MWWNTVSCVWYIKNCYFFIATLSFEIYTRNLTNLKRFSAYEVKNNSCLFQRLFKVQKNGVFLFGISFFVLEILTFLYYANEGSDDVIDRSTRTVQRSIKNISGNIKAVFLKLGTRNVHHKRNKIKLKFPDFILHKDHPLPTI